MMRSLWVAVLFAFPLFPMPTVHAALPEQDLAKQQLAMKAYGNLPMSFTANRGQYDAGVAFVTQGSGYSISLANHEAILSLPRSVHHGTNAAFAKAGSVETYDPDTSPDIHMQFVSAASNVAISGVEELAGKANFLVGDDPSKWHTAVPTYSKVKYTSLYPGIDLVYYGNQQHLEFDFIVEAGADPNSIKLNFRGSTAAEPVSLRINQAGDLLIGEQGREIVLPRPTVYQPAGKAELSSTKHRIDADYVLSGTHEVHFRVSAYDKSKPLVIDPTVAYSALLNTAETTVASGVAVDSSGSAYITGSMEGSLYDHNVFVMKLNPSGTALVYSTYLGQTSQYFGSGESFAYGIAVDAVGDAFIVGSTSNSSYPTTPGAFQVGGGYLGGGAAFVSKLNPSGSKLIYSTLLGAGTSAEENSGATAIVLDSTGQAYVAGTTSAMGFPTTLGAYQTTPGPYEYSFASGFLTKINSSGSALVYSTYLPGTTGEPGLAVDASGSAYLTGSARSKFFPTTPGPLSPTGTSFVMKLNPAGSAPVYATFLLGHSMSTTGIAIDASGSAYVTGYLGALCSPPRDEDFLCSPGTNVPGNIYITPGVYQGTSDGFGAFVSKLNPAGSALIYSTYLGDRFPGVSDGPFPFQYFDYTALGAAIAVDARGNAYVTGRSSSTNFPVTAGAFQTTLPGSTSGFLTELNATGTDLLYSTFLGGSDFSYSVGIALDPLGNVYVSGGSDSLASFPTTPGAYHFPQTASYEGAFVAKFAPTPMGTTSQSIAFAFLANQVYGAGPVPLTATASSGLPVKYSFTGPATIQGSNLVLSGTGTVTLTALQEGDAQYAAAKPVVRSFRVNKAVLEATADNVIRNAGVPNPVLTYTLTGFLLGDTSSVVSGAATETTTATLASGPGTYPITFDAESLVAANYSIVYVSGTLTIGTPQCQTISSYADSFTAAGLSLNHGATISATRLQLTDGGGSEARSAFYTTPVSIVAFTTDFNFQMFDPVADGFTFTVQSNNPTIFGIAGGGLGYEGIPHSAAIKFDLHNNQGEGFDSMGFYQDGVDPTVPDVDLGPRGINLHSSDIFHVHIAYANPIVTVTITDTQTGASTTATFQGDLSSTVGTNAYVGFTAGTGAKTAIQNILKWSYTGGAGCTDVQQQ